MEISSYQAADLNEVPTQMVEPNASPADDDYMKFANDKKTSSSLAPYSQ